MIKFPWTPRRSAPGLYFFHIPKTAGMSLIASLDQHYAAEDIYTGHLLDELLACDPAELSQYRLFRGHFGLVLHDVIKQPMSRAVLLRDPIARAVSMYGHVWRDDSHFGYERVHAPGYSFSDFVNDPYFRPIISNHQARYLAFRPGRSHFQWKPPVSPAHQGSAQVVHDLYPLEMTPEEFRRTALSTLEATDVVGMTEYLQEAYQLLAYRMGWDAHTVPGRVNVGTLPFTVKDISRADRTTLEEMNTIDRELVEVALRRLRIDRRAMVDRFLNISGGTRHNQRVGEQTVNAKAADRQDQSGAGSRFSSRTKFRSRTLTTARQAHNILLIVPRWLASDDVKRQLKEMRQDHPNAKITFLAEAPCNEPDIRWLEMPRIRQGQSLAISKTLVQLQRTRFEETVILEDPSRNEVGYGEAKVWAFSANTRRRSLGRLRQVLLTEELTDKIRRMPLLRNLGSSNMQRGARQGRG